MGTDLTPDTVLAFAPDAASAASGRGLASARKWTGLGFSDRAVWGLCQGSGKDPYQARVDLREIAFKCGCPSRKFPCKHGLGLLLLYAQERGAFKNGPEPGWVSEWLDGRAQKAEKKAEKVKAAAEAPPDPEAQSKRAAAREARVRGGVSECRTWLDDLVRRGLAAAQGEASAEWDRVAARMVDAQAPGLAGFVRQIPRCLASGVGWEVRTLDVLGRLHLLLTAAERVGELPAALAGDVRAALGYPQSKDDVLGGAEVSDRWVVLGQVYSEDERLTVRRSWLWGARTASVALVLDFAAGTQPLDTSLVAGTAFEGEIAFYPSGAPLRGLVKTRGESVAAGAAFADDARHTIGANLERYARALGANPWLVRWPMVLTGAAVVRSGERWLLRRGEEVLPLSPSFERGVHLWRLVSATGGREATIALEWDGESAEPVGAFVEGGAGGYLGLAPRWAA